MPRKKKEEKEEIKPEDVSEVNDILKKDSKCVMCNRAAEYCMRGLPENTYCKTCAKDYFKLLSYLDKL